MRITTVLKPLLWTSAMFGLACILLVPIFISQRRGEHYSNCQSNLSLLVIGYSQYVRDSDSASPPISIKNEGWADLLQPYARSWDIFQCPAGQKSPALWRTDYFYNARLAKVKASQIRFPVQTIVFGDGTDNSGTNSHLSELPLNWKSTNEEELRHSPGNNYAFVGGHVKWVRGEHISNQAPSKNLDNGNLTFALR